MAKQWWQSKTLWLNVISLALVVVQGLQGEAWLRPEYQVVILAVLNASLRFITSKPLTTKRSKRRKKPPA